MKPQEKRPNNRQEPKQSGNQPRKDGKDNKLQKPAKEEGPVDLAALDRKHKEKMQQLEKLTADQLNNVNSANEYIRKHAINAAYRTQGRPEKAESSEQGSKRKKNRTHKKSPSNKTLRKAEQYQGKGKDKEVLHDQPDPPRFPQKALTKKEKLENKRNELFEKRKVEELVQSDVDDAASEYSADCSDEEDLNPTRPNTPEPIFKLPRWVCPIIAKHARDRLLDMENPPDDPSSEIDGINYIETMNTILTELATEIKVIEAEEKKADRLNPKTIQIKAMSQDEKLVQGEINLLEAQARRHDLMDPRTAIVKNISQNVQVLKAEIEQIELTEKKRKVEAESDLNVRFANDSNPIEAPKVISFPYVEKLPDIYDVPQMAAKLVSMGVSLGLIIGSLYAPDMAASGFLSILSGAIYLSQKYLIVPQKQLPIVQMSLISTEEITRDGRGDMHKHHAAKHTNTVNTYKVRYPHVCKVHRDKFTEIKSYMTSTSIYDDKTHSLFLMKELIEATEQFPCTCPAREGTVRILQENVDQVMTTVVRRGTYDTIRAFIDSGVSSYPFSVYDRKSNAQSYDLLGTSNFLLLITSDMNVFMLECIITLWITPNIFTWDGAPVSAIS